MLIDTTQPISDYEGNPVTDPSGKRISFRDAVSIALNNPMPGENPTAEEKSKAFRITSLVFSQPAVELDIADSAFIVERSGAVTSALVHGRICEILEGSRLSAIESTTPISNGATPPVETPAR